MKKACLVAIILFTAFLQTMGQSLDSVNHEPEPRPLKFGPFIAPMIEMTNIKGSSGFSLGAHLGTIINDVWQVSAFIQVYNGTYSRRVIFPNSFVLDYSYAGGFVNYAFFKKGNLKILSGVKVASGEASWSQIETLDILDTDNFIAFNPNLGIDYKFSRFTILNVSLGYRIISGLNLPELGSSGLNNVSLDATLKLGWFK